LLEVLEVGDEDEEKWLEVWKERKFTATGLNSPRPRVLVR
jgi:hypothetical protein